MPKKIKILALSALSMCVLSLPFSVKAASAEHAPLIIDNQTAFPSTSKINNQTGHAQCSHLIPNYGVTPAHTKNTIPSGVVWLACLANLDSCTADVYMTNNCTGPVIASVVFNYFSGIQTVTNNYGPEGFIIPAPNGPFSMEILGGPAA